MIINSKYFGASVAGILLAWGSVVTAGELYGQVTMGGKPLVNAKVEARSGGDGANPPHDHTDNQGYYSIRDLTPGRYEVRVFQPGSQNQVARKSVPVDDKSTQMKFVIK